MGTVIRHVLKKEPGLPDPAGEIHEYNGLRWWVPPVTTEGLAFKNYLPLSNWEGDVRDWVLNNIQPSGVFLDIGANTGTYTINMAKRFDQVHAVEPHPTNIQILEQNRKLNEIRNITIIPKAAWDEDCKLYLRETTPGDTSAGPYCAREPPGIEVEGLRIDELHLTPGLLKIDVEGYASHVFLGGLETVKAARAIVLENHNDEEKAWAERLAAEFGYTIRTRLGDKTILTRSL